MARISISRAKVVTSKVNLKVRRVRVLAATRRVRWYRPHRERRITSIPRPNVRHVIPACTGM